MEIEGNYADSVQSNSDRNHYREDHGTNCSAYSVGSTKDSADINDDADTHSLGSWKDECDMPSEHAVEASTSTPSPSLKKSWADMALEDELAAEESNDESNGYHNVNGSISEGTSVVETKPKVELSRDEREQIRFNNVERKKDFICLERVGGKIVNILDGLELHKGVFSAAEQKRIVNYVEDLQQMGRNGELKGELLFMKLIWF